jgi:hypothetical protein
MEGEEKTKTEGHSTQGPKNISKDFASFTDKKEIPKITKIKCKNVCQKQNINLPVPKLSKSAKENIDG